MIVSIKYGSHLPVLTKIVGMTDGPILELGIGLYSTTFLHYACLPTKRELVSYDSDKDWVHNFEDCRSDFHEIILVEDWNKLDVNHLWDVVLVDHNRDRRKIEAERLANFAKYVILHDSEPQNNRWYSEIYPFFKYRFDYKDCLPHTTVLSNFINLSDFKI